MDHCIEHAKYTQTICYFMDRMTKILSTRDNYSRYKSKEIGCRDQQRSVLGHEVESAGLNMMQEMIESTVAFTKPESLGGFRHFLG